MRSARLLPVRRKNHGRRRERGAAPRKLSPPPRDLARPPENLWPKNPLAKPHRRGEEALRKLAGVLRQSPEKVHAGAAKETGVQLYRPCGMASVLPTCRNMSISRRRGGKRTVLTLAALAKAGGCRAALNCGDEKVEKPRTGGGGASPSPWGD